MHKHDASSNENINVHVSEYIAVSKPLSLVRTSVSIQNNHFNLHRYGYKNVHCSIFYVYTGKAEISIR